MTSPTKSSVWASQVDPVVREYITARINEELKPLRDDIATLRVALSNNKSATEASLGEQAAKLNDQEALLGLPSYKIAKLLELAQKG